MSTKQEIQKAEKFFNNSHREYYYYFVNLLHNAIVIENLPKDVPKRYFLRVLFSNGQIGHYGNESNDIYLPANGIGVDLYGLPTQYTLVAYNGFTITKPAREIGILRINDLAYPIYPYLNMQARKLADIDGAIKQNLKSIQAMRIYECKDQATLLSMQNVWKALDKGACAAFQVKGAFETKVTPIETGSQYLCDKLTELKKEIKNETLSRIGVMSANTDKRERVQVAEVNASLGETVDAIEVNIDTFNYDAEQAGLPLRMRLKNMTELFIQQQESELKIEENINDKDERNG